MKGYKIPGGDLVLSLEEKEQYSTSSNAIFTHKFKKRIHGFRHKIKILHKPQIILPFQLFWVCVCSVFCLR